MRTILFAALLAGIAVPASAQSCRDEVGSRQAARYVRDCLAVSAATHPPCNAANPCALILDEIRRNCDQDDSADACRRYED